MRILISADLEGVAGVVDRDETMPGAPEYERARRLLTEEASAAVRGALAHDAEAEVLVVDAHALFRNILPEDLDPRARLVRGRPRSACMLTGVEDDVDAVVLLGHHGKAGTADSVLAHTINGRVIADVRCDGRSLGEIALNMTYAAHFGANTVLVTGDASATAEATALAPRVRTVEVKRGLGAFAADCLHPQEARARIEEAMPDALAARHSAQPFRLQGPIALEVDVQHPSMCEQPLLVPGMERSGGCTLRYAAADLPAAYRIVELVALLGMPI